MDSESLRDICIESCDQLLNYYKDHQNDKYPPGDSSNDVLRYDILPNGYVTLYVSQKVMDAADMKLKLDKMFFTSDKLNFEYIDNINKSVTIHPHKLVLDLLKNNQNKSANKHDKIKTISLISDMRWLVTRTRDYYENNGHLLRIPEKTESFADKDCSFPTKKKATEEQMNAVKTILNEKMCYVWGAPGTGKTQMVLASSITSLLKKGKRIAVLAPTNNSIEQVLKGILSALEDEDPNNQIIDRETEILRVGIPTREFAEKHGSICELRGISKRIKNLDSQLELLNDVLFEKKCEIIKNDFDEIESIIQQYEKQPDVMFNKLLPFLNNIKTVLEQNEMFKYSIDNVDKYNVKTYIDDLTELLYDRERPALNIKDYESWSLNKLRTEIDKISDEKTDLMLAATSDKMKKAKIIAMTPQTMMGRFVPPGSKNLQMPQLNVDHIFIDEVGYSNVIQALPAYMFGVPVTLLGDHKQLPPVCEVNEDDINYAILTYLDNMTTDKCYNYRYLFMWAQSAIFSESYLTEDSMRDIMITYNIDEPKLELMKKCTLTESHRFGPNLGAILDDCIYKNGIKGVAEDPLIIICLDVKCYKRDSRVNEKEADAVIDYIENEMEDDEDFIVLTPYKKQMKHIWKNYKEYRKDVMNVHKSQGREWNTVILTVCDNAIPIPSKSGNQYQFTSTIDSKIGANVMNTAVSRARKKLVLVCDKEFWLSREGEMIGRMAKDADKTITFN